MSVSRRNFIRNASLTSALSFVFPEIISSAFAGDTSINKIKIKKDDIILFQGDSITDAGRKKDDSGFNTANVLGNGYAMIAASELLFNNPSKNLKFYNRGVSGNKVFELSERWAKDCLELKPDVLSINIGVNDFWHTLLKNYTGTLKTYREDYTKLLDQTKQKLPGVKLLIGEPFAVTGINKVDEKWYPVFNEYRLAAHEIAANFEAVFIPYQKLFDKAQQSAPGVYWTYDGVHPTIAGAQLMAHAWLAAVRI